MKHAIDRSAFIEEFCGQIDPLFDRADQLIKALVDSQELLAEYIVPDSVISDRDVINSLLGILDNRNLIVLIRELTIGES